MVACIECVASDCNIITLSYSAPVSTGRGLPGLTVCGWCFAMAIISDLSLLVAVCVCHCAVPHQFIAKAEEERRYMKKAALPKALRKA